MLVGRRRIRFELIPQQLVDAGLGAGLRVDPLDDHGAGGGRAGWPSYGRAGRCRHDDGVCRHLADKISPLSRSTIFVDGPRNAPSTTPRLAHDHALGHLGARADEAIVLNNGGLACSGSSTPPMPAPPEMCTRLPIWAQEPTIAQVSIIAHSST